MGGMDLIFPHHENEIAQSEAAHGQKFANYWVHNEMVRVEGQKMSKSLGNFVLLRDLFQKYSPENLRFFMAQTHYRQVIDFNPTHLHAAHVGLNKLYAALLKGKEFDHGPEKKSENTTSPLNQPLTQKLLEEALSILSEDLNTPKLLSLWFGWAKEIQKSEKQEDVLAFQAALCQSGNWLGILQTPPQVWFQKAEKKGDFSQAEIEEWVKKRERARADKNWQEADRIRTLLEKKGIMLVDSEQGTLWKRD